MATPPVSADGAAAPVAAGNQPAAPAAVPAPAAQAAAAFSEEAFVATVIDALGANQTDAARAGLKQLLLGELKTTIPDLAVTGLAAKAILAKPKPAEEELLFAAVIDPTVLRPNAVADPALHGIILSAIDERASSEARVALSDNALRKKVADDKRKIVTDLVMKPDARNLAAQSKLFRSSKVDAATKSELERRFTGYSVAAINQLLGFGVGQLPVAAGQPPADGPDAAAKQLQAVVNGIWNENVLARLEEDAKEAKTYNDFAEPLKLAVSIPTKQSRTIQGELHQEHWSEGSKDIKLGERFGDQMQDPGLLVVIKRIPRKEEPPEQKSRTPRAAGRQRRGGGGERTEKEEKARYEWMKSAEEFVQSLNSRFLAAAKAGAGQQHLISNTPPPEKPARTSQVSTGAGRDNATESEPAAVRAGRFPLQLHEDAHITNEYHLSWPEDLPRNLRTSDMTPMAVHYVRMEDTASLVKLNTHYHKQLKGVVSRPRPNGRWMDWYGQGVEHGQARTTDIIFTRTLPEDERPGSGTKPKDKDAGEEESSGRRALDEPEPLVIEILVVEIPEYRVAPNDEADPLRVK